MDFISIAGARMHNLKSVNVKIPRGKMTVVTGLSGSGKSSLAFDTLFAEGQRLYVESLSAYARNFLNLMPRPDVDEIIGLSPAIAIDQKRGSTNPRSTVGTMTELSDYFRLLFARAGVPYCPEHHHALSLDTIASMVEKTVVRALGQRIMVLSPVKGRGTEDYRAYFATALASGYMRFRIDGKVEVLEQPVALNDGCRHQVEIVVDRLTVRAESRTRLAESFESAALMSSGRVTVVMIDTGESFSFSNRYACPECDYTVPRLEPNLFSSNNPKGCCPHCKGLGMASEFDVKKIVPYPTLSLESGAIPGWDRRNQNNLNRLKTLAQRFKFSLDTPWSELPQEIREIILYGNDISRHLYPPFEGIVTRLEEMWKDAEQSKGIREGLGVYRSESICRVCQGQGLRPEILSVYVGDGERRYSIQDIGKMTLSDLSRAVEALKFDKQHRVVADRILETIKSRIRFLEDVGLGYLTMNRRTTTLSGGEAQRIRLASQVGSGLTGVLYVLDEPSIGLHQRDNDRLIDSLEKLRDLDNTLVVVEHDEDAIRRADFLIDMGPGAGEKGGQVVATGTPSEVIANPNSLTGRYLSGERVVSIPLQRSRPEHGWLKLIGATGHNLKNVDLEIPLGLLTVITGVSGSGKSSLITQTLYPKMAELIHRAQKPCLPFSKIENWEKIKKVVSVDQTSIGTRPRSNPATYTGLFSEIREVFAMTQMARERGYKSSRFSFNVKGGRCEACQGDGMIRMEMHFLPDIYVPCEVCNGKRYNRETLEVKYKGFSIADILEMTVSQAKDVFQAYPKIERILNAFEDVGLGYIRLGQSASTFSGGEAQRIKLAAELAKPENGESLYILDEPTTGLHFEDIAQLMKVLQQLTKQGNTVVVIEHNLDVIKCADWIVDIGPEGGEAGGYIVGAGTPEHISELADSLLAPYLKKALERKAR